MEATKIALEQQFAEINLSKLKNKYFGNVQSAYVKSGIFARRPNRRISLVKLTF